GAEVGTRRRRLTPQPRPGQARWSHMVNPEQLRARAEECEAKAGCCIASPPLCCGVCQVDADLISSASKLPDENAIAIYPPRWRGTPQWPKSRSTIRSIGASVPKRPAPSLTN